MDERMTESERATLCRRIDELCAENERLRQENQSIGMAAYEIGYRNGSVHYELEHCPACKNIADLQEALEENAKLRKLATLNWEWAHACCGDGCRLKTEYCGYAIDRECNYEREIHDLMVELGVDDA